MNIQNTEQAQETCLHASKSNIPPGIFQRIKLNAVRHMRNCSEK